jgi:hypothetical protein
MPPETAPEGSGATPGTPAAEGATPPTATPAATDPAREASELEGGARDDSREAGAPTDEEGWRKALNTERDRRRKAEKAARDAVTAERERSRAGMSELERVTAERDEIIAERDDLAGRLSAMERRTLAATIAAELGIPDWSDDLERDADEKAMREHGLRIRERTGLGRGSFDGGTRSVTAAPPQPRDMDALIRRKAGRSRG